MMSVSTRFFKFASVCAPATALTTLAIHHLPELWADADTFEEQLQLRHNSIYLARLWVVILHCLLVVVSMFAVGVHTARCACSGQVWISWLPLLRFQRNAQDIAGNLCAQQNLARGL